MPVPGPRAGPPEEPMRTPVRFPLAIQDPSGLLFGVAPRPLSVGRGLTLGGGLVIPEISFSPPMPVVDAGTWKDVVKGYRRTAEAVTGRARALEVPGLVIDFEHPPAMTERPEWGAEVTALLREALDRSGLPNALRVTVADLRDRARPLRLRSGPAWEAMRESWRRCGAAGADILCMESVGGKEAHDQALLYGDVAGLALSLGVLAARDMEWLWTELVASVGGAVPGSDSACGFANAAMELANRRMLPEILATVVRAMGAARSLIAFECGARGPSKGCAHEGPVLKAVTGCPIAMAGKGAVFAQPGPLGNIAGAAADLWSSGAVPDVALRCEHAPEAALEALAYDVRLLNAAAARGRAALVRDLLVESDELRTPQALVLGPPATLLLARAIVQHAGDDYRRTLRAGRSAVGIIEEAVGDGRLLLAPNEARWLERVSRALEEIPNTAEALLAEAGPRYREHVDPANYGL
jgi:methanol--5-hydroxybenzimidazolylcobamide Co-methyltransferase